MPWLHGGEKAGTEAPVGGMQAVCRKREHSMVSVGIVGGSGYMGGEALRVLLRRPHVAVQALSVGECGRRHELLLRGDGCRRRATKYHRYVGVRQCRQGWGASRDREEDGEDSEVRLASTADLEALVSLATAFRDYVGLSAPSEADLRTSIARLLQDRDTEFFVACSACGGMSCHPLRLPTQCSG